MRQETPEFKRCCICIPLRRGLIGWGYIKLAMNAATFAYMIMLFYTIWLYDIQYGYMTVKDYATIAVIFAILLADSCFLIIFIVAGHQKSLKLLKVSYIYNMVILGLLLLGHLIFICHRLYHTIKLSERLGSTFFIFDFMIGAGLAFSVIFVQIYLTLLIRSEMIKLQNQSLEMQFSNRWDAGQPQCTL